MKLLIERNSFNYLPHYFWNRVLEVLYLKIKRVTSSKSTVKVQISLGLFEKGG